MHLVTIYNLKDDKQYLRDLQSVSKDERTNFGLAISEVGLVGSPEWWNAVERGGIPKQVIEGKISKVYKTGHNDFPQFDINSGGSITSWERYGNWQYYKVGNDIKITYVLSKFKVPLEGVGDFSSLVLTVEATQVDLIKEPFDGFEMV